MVMWLMSDRSIPRSYRMMDGFGVHTFRLAAADGTTHLVKFHWKAVLGAHALVWEEAQLIAGKDPDFHRRDLWNALEHGVPAEYELALQLIPEAEADRLGIDLLDATKLVPEELVPLRRVGRLVLHRNPGNFFAETEQVAFCPANLVPGIELTDDPLLQARLFSYLDTQLTRLGGPNFAELPINRPLVPVTNHQQDGFGRHAIPVGKGNYVPNSLSGGKPTLHVGAEGSYSPTPRPVQGRVERGRDARHADDFSQARLFLASQTPVEAQHLLAALRFEIGKVESPGIRQRVVERLLLPIDAELAAAVADTVGVALPSRSSRSQPLPEPSPSLSMLAMPVTSAATRRVAVLAAPGADAAALAILKAGLDDAGVQFELIAPMLGELPVRGEPPFHASATLLSTSSVVYDAVVVADTAALAADPAAVRFVAEAWRHRKTIAAWGAGVTVLAEAQIPDPADAGMARDWGLLREQDGPPAATAVVAAIARHRHWLRPLPVEGAEPRQP